MREPVSGSLLRATVLLLLERVGSGVVVSVAIGSVVVAVWVIESVKADIGGDIENTGIIDIVFIGIVDLQRLRHV